MSRIRPRPPRARRLYPFALALALALFLAPASSFAFTPNGAIEGFNPVAIVPEFPCNTEDVRLLFTICTDFFECWHVNPQSEATFAFSNCCGAKLQ